MTFLKGKVNSFSYFVQYYKEILKITLLTPSTTIDEF